MSGNVIALGSKRKPIANIILEEPVVNQMPKTIKGPWAAALNESFIIPDEFVAWMDVIQFRDGIGKIWDDEADGAEDDTAVAIILNNVCRRDTSGNIRWRMDRRKIVLEVLNVFKGKAYIEFHPGYTGISIVVNGEAAQAGRGYGHYRWIAILDYSQDEPLPMSGNQLAAWSIAEPLEHQVGLDWLHERFMVPDESDESDTVNTIIDLLLEELYRLQATVENGLESSTLLSNEQQLSVYKTLFDLLNTTDYFPYTLLDGFIPDGE